MNKEQFISHAEVAQKTLRRFLTALCCGDVSLADEIAQETFVKAYLSCEGFKSDSRFDTWLHRIALNTFLNHRRVKSRTTGYDEAREIPSTEKADNAFRYQELYEALERLPEKERSAILLFYLEGYSSKEIAALLECSDDSVRQYLSRGRSRLKEMLAEL